MEWEERKLSAVMVFIIEAKDAEKEWSSDVACRQVKRMKRNTEMDKC